MKRQLTSVDHLKLCISSCVPHHPGSAHRVSDFAWITLSGQIMLAVRAYVCVCVCFYMQCLLIHETNFLPWHRRRAP